MTPDSPVGGLIRLDFSQNNIKLVSRVFGKQVLCRSFQPFGCSRRLYTMYPIVSPQSYIKVGMALTSRIAPFVSSGADDSLHFIPRGGVVCPVAAFNYCGG